MNTKDKCERKQRKRALYIKEEEKNKEDSLSTSWQINEKERKKIDEIRKEKMKRKESGLKDKK